MSENYCSIHDYIGEDCPTCDEEEFDEDPDYDSYQQDCDDIDGY